MNVADPVHGRLVCATQDLESSLGNMRLIADLLLREEEELPAPVRREYLGALAQKVSRLQAVAEDMTALAKIQAQQILLERCPMRVSEILQQAIEASSGNAASKRVTVQSAIADDEPCITGDYWKLSRAFDGILQSVLRATPPGGSVAVNVEPFVSGVQVVFRRLGSLVDLNRAVGFFQEESASGSSDLALSLSAQLVGLHGGTLHSSDRESMYSVTVRLPSATVGS